MPRGSAPTTDHRPARGRGCALVLALAAETLAVWGPGWADAQEQGADVVRYAGGSRAGTSADVSANLWEEGADTVVIANGDDFPDALSGAPLATSLDAPLLLASRDSLDPTVEDELERLGASTAVLLGGTAVLSEELEEVLDDAGIRTVERIAGGDRFATAAAVAGALEADQPVATSRAAPTSPTRCRARPSRRGAGCRCC